MGGLFSIFHKKSASKAPKTCDFAYFTSQWGGSSPPHPPPGNATAYIEHKTGVTSVATRDVKAEAVKAANFCGSESWKR